MKLVSRLRKNMASLSLRLISRKTTVFANPLKYPGLRISTVSDIAVAYIQHFLCIVAGVHINEKVLLWKYIDKNRFLLGDL